MQYAYLVDVRNGDSLQHVTILETKYDENQKTYVDIILNIQIYKYLLFTTGMLIIIFYWQSDIKSVSVTILSLPDFIF